MKEPGRMSEVRAVVHLSAWCAMVTVGVVMVAGAGKVQEGVGALSLSAMLAWASVPPKSHQSLKSAGRGLAKSEGVIGSARRNTGRWWRDGEAELVRWDPVIGVYFVNGEAWPDAGQLALHLTDLECRGWVADVDPDTVAIREALGVRGWHEMLERGGDAG